MAEDESNVIRKKIDDANQRVKILSWLDVAIVNN